MGRTSAKSNAFNNLSCYQQTPPSFNDDIQNTRAVVLAGICRAVRVKGRDPGPAAPPGSMAPGLAGRGGGICAGMIREGLDPQAARDRIYILDTQGLGVTTARLDEYKTPLRLSWARCWPSGILQAKAGLTEVRAIAHQRAARHQRRRWLPGRSISSCAGPLRGPVIPLSTPPPTGEALPE